LLVYVFSLVMLAACASMTDADITTDETVRELTALANAWDIAIVTKNAPGIEVNMAADFKQIRGSGNIVSREQFIREIVDPSHKIDPYDVDDFSVRVLGDVALLYGRIRMTGMSDGERFESHFRYIDVYARRGGKWQVVSVQITPMPTEPKK
jgi:ketosteroid isomerase-like protein